MSKSSFVRLFLVLCALSLAVSAQQNPPLPFIEPAEHQHGKRSAKLMTVPANVNVTGWWKTLPVMMPINPVHVALMHTGKVLVVSGSGNDPNNRVLTAGIYDPPAETMSTFRIGWDMFCNGMIVLPDGRPFVLGGTLRYDPFFGEPRTAFFDPAAGAFANGPSMGNGRWYPTGTVLGDGSVMVISGLGSNGPTNTSVQIYRAATNTFTAAGSSFANPPLYPRQHLLPSGKVFESGANPNTQQWDPASHVWTNVATTKFGQARDYGTSVLLPLTPANAYKPKVLILGGGPGGKNVTASSETIDLSAAPPSWTFGPNMVSPRIQLNATILPNGKVLVSGGSTEDEKPSTAVLRAELYDPAANTFAPAGTMEFARLYHSNTLLLPDATVLAVGGNPERTVYEPHIEVYFPPYLFKADGTPAPRPPISAAGDVRYGSTFPVRSAAAAYIRSVVLIRAGAVTHAFDMDQRLVGLRYAASGDTLTVQAPANGNIAPPGWYLLFIVDSSGVPSVGQFVRLG